MNTGIQKVVELQGPSISGTVTVPLLELDKMRMDHANAVAIANELKEKEKSVKLTVVEKRENWDYTQRGNRILRDDRYVELGVEYKNLDDFREIIRKEEHDKIHNQFLEFTRNIQKLEDKLVGNEKLISKMSSDLAECKKANGILITENEALKKDNEKLTTDFEGCSTDFKKQLAITDGINERLKLSLKEINYWKNRNSFWGWLWK